MQNRSESLKTGVLAVQNKSAIFWSFFWLASHSTMTMGQSELVYTSHKHAEVVYIDSTASPDCLIKTFSNYIRKTREENNAVDAEGVLRELLKEDSFLDIDLRTERIKVPGHVIDESISTASYDDETAKVNWSRFSHEFKVSFGSNSGEGSWPKFIRRLNFAVMQSSLRMSRTSESLICTVRSKMCDNAIVFGGNGDRLVVTQRVFIVREVTPIVIDIDSMALNSDIDRSLKEKSRMIWREP
jgi:hypothetical protein